MRRRNEPLEHRPSLDDEDVDESGRLAERLEELRVLDGESSALLSTP